jgi:hypothetical protein
MFEGREVRRSRTKSTSQQLLPDIEDGILQEVLWCGGPALGMQDELICSDEW